ncbi:MAG: D-alanine--D-alanine ligase [Candidatus Omnitrophica bacterium]|jgi:D-alanine-D-alanine ligase|nr:D-alanine--D-alanine ligase [Candidatus Omnitrophota bacterium]
MAVSKQADYGKIGVLMGGSSSEREVSLKSGKAVYESLKQAGLDVIGIDITSDKADDNINLIKSEKIDCAFLALHGRFGEDGAIQEILENVNIPYTGSGVLSSKLSMDKIASRKVLEVYNLAVPKYIIIDKVSQNDNLSLSACLGLPLVIKPATHGSSIGLSIPEKEEEIKPALELAFKFDDKVVAEEYIRGRELTVGILEDEALPVIEIVPKKRFFDYEAKYQAGFTEYIVPAVLEENIAKLVQSAALKTHKLLGCFGCSRVDIILSRDNTPYILELNSIPGFTPTSLLPKAAKVAGIEFSQLCFKLIQLAYEKAEAKISL